MTAIEDDSGVATMKSSDWQTLLAHVRQMDADGASYREEIAVLRAENARLKARVNDLVGVVKEQQVALDERNAIIAEYKEQKREIVADVATVSAALQKASDAWADSPELAKRNDALGAGAPGNGIKAAAIIDGIRALLALAENAGVPRQAMLYLLSFCIKLAEMPEGKMDEFMAYFTGGHDNREKKPGGRTRSVSETMVTAQIAAFYEFLKEENIPAAEAMEALASACGLKAEKSAISIRTSPAAKIERRRGDSNGKPRRLSRRWSRADLVPNRPRPAFSSGCSSRTRRFSLTFRNRKAKAIRPADVPKATRTVLVAAARL